MTSSESSSVISLIGDRRAVVRYALLLTLSSAVRAAAVLSLFPLLTSLFGDRSVALMWTVVLAVLVVAAWAIDFRVADAGFGIGFSLLSGLESHIAQRLPHIPLGWLTPDRRAEARKALTSSGRELCQAIGWLVAPAVSGLLTPALIGIGLLFVAPALGLVALAAVPVLMGMLWLGMRLTKTADNAYAAASKQTASRIIELAQAQPVLRAAGQAGAGGTTIGKALERQRRAVLRLVGFGLPGQLAFGLAAQAALLALAVAAVRSGLSAAACVALVIVAVRFIEPFTTLADLSPALQNLRNTVARVRTLLNAPVLGSGTAAAPQAQAPALELRDVSFAYAPGKPVLEGVSFTVPRGTTTAIVGPSGTGKSTLLSLIARFHEVDAGGVRVFGNDVRDYDPAVLMKQLGIVFQDVYLFEASLADNVRLGNPDATEEQFASAASAAQLDELVARLPQGWQTRVGERGATLSGGERQRVSIARALLKDAPILLLDEATAALDAANEKAIVHALESSGGNRSTVIVAHRLTTIARADQILFLESGRVAESGTLAQLLEANGRFAAYWRQRELAAGWSLAAGEVMPV